MNPTIASVIVGVGILGLFWLDHDSTVRTSKALWIPSIWLLIAASRAPSAWFQSPTQGLEDVTYIEGNPFERNLFSAMILAALFVVLMRRRKIFQALKENAPILIFVFYCAVSLLWSDYPSVGIRRWTKLVGDLAMVLIVTTDPDPAGAFDRLTSRVGFLVLPISLLFIRYYPAFGRSYDIWSGGMYWTGVTSTKNGLGMICMLVGLAAVWRLLRDWRCRRHRRKAIIAQSALLLMSVFLLHEANSATATACFALGSALIVVLHLFRFARRVPIVRLIGVSLMLLASCAAFFNVAGLVNELGRNSDLTGRRELWSIVLSQPVSRLLGAGYESFWVGQRVATIQRLNGQFANQCHNGYLEILVNLGWMGIAFLGFVIITGYWNATAAFRINSELKIRRLTFFLVPLIYNLTEAGFKMADPVWIFFVWALLCPVTTPNVRESVHFLDFVWALLSPVTTSGRTSSEIGNVDTIAEFSHDGLSSSPAYSSGLSPRNSQNLAVMATSRRDSER